MIQTEKERRNSAHSFQVKLTSQPNIRFTLAKIFLRSESIGIRLSSLDKNEEKERSFEISVEPFYLFLRFCIYANSVPHIVGVIH